MKAILVAKRFHPGQISHLDANAKLLEARGFDVKFSLHQRHQSLPDFNLWDKNAKLLDWLALRKGDLYIVWFPSVSALVNLLCVRMFTLATTIYVYHEPYTSFASYRRAGFGWLKTVRVTAISFVSLRICSLSQKIILPSIRAFNAVPEARLNPQRYAKLNLMFADESDPQTTGKARIYLSYIGTIAEDHAFDEFVRLMQITIDHQSLMPFKFLIATRSEIPLRLRSVIDQCVSSGRLVLNSGSPMTNRLINSFYSESFVVWNAYKRSMQSGVLPKAYMFGAPVLVSFSNQSEFFIDGIHGVLISDRYSLDEFQQAIIRFQESWHEMSRNCRIFYMQNFDYTALASKFINFVSE